MGSASLPRWGRPALTSRCVAFDVAALARVRLWCESLRGDYVVFAKKPYPAQSNSGPRLNVERLAVLPSPHPPQTRPPTIDVLLLHQHCFGQEVGSPHSVPRLVVLVESAEAAEAAAWGVEAVGSPVVACRRGGDNERGPYRLSTIHHSRSRSILANLVDSPT